MGWGHEKQKYEMSGWNFHTFFCSQIMNIFFMHFCTVSLLVHKPTCHPRSLGSLQNTLSFFSQELQHKTLIFPCLSINNIVSRTKGELGDVLHLSSLVQDQDVVFPGGGVVVVCDRSYLYPPAPCCPSGTVIIGSIDTTWAVRGNSGQYFLLSSMSI